MNLNDIFDSTFTISSNAKPCKHFDSKFSKNFQRQIRVYVNSIFKVYTKKFKKPHELNKLEKDFFWIVITYFINRKVGISMNMDDIKSLYFRKHSSQQKSRLSRIHDKRRLIKKIMKQ